MSRFRRSRRSSSARAAVALGLALLVWVGCQSGPMRALAGARHYAAGSEALDCGHVQQAIAELEQAARLVPHASEIRNHLGLAYWQAGDTGGARAAFEHALELDCENQAARSNLARLAQAEPRAADAPRRADAGGSDDHGG